MRIVHQWIAFEQAASGHPCSSIFDAAAKDASDYLNLVGDWRALIGGDRSLLFDTMENPSRQRWHYWA